MNTIGLMVTPGVGYSEVEVTSNTTVADLVSKHNLHGRTITLDGREVAPDDYSSTTLADVDDVWATGGAKGA